MSRDKNQITTYAFLAFWLHRLSAEVIKRFESALSVYGVTVAQWNILLLLNSHDSNSPRTISDLAGVDAGAVSRTIDRLCSKGLVERIYDQEDGRSVRIALTSAGQALIEPTLKIAIEQDLYWTQQMKNISREELADLFQNLLASDVLKEKLVPSKIISRDSRPG